jgi:glycerol-3-phosphate acyltransferase PlsY
MRVLGKKPGYTVFACDALKGLLAVILGKYIAAPLTGYFASHTVLWE